MNRGALGRHCPCGMTSGVARSAWGVAALLALLLPTLGEAAELSGESVREQHRLGLFVGTGYLGTPSGHGVAISGGLRFPLGRHLALGFDVGYGFTGAHAAVEDRWWLLPSAAFVVPLGRWSFELGVGAGLGTASGFASWSAYTSDHTDWAYQLAPAGRLHARVAFDVSPGFTLFARFEVATLWTQSNVIGFREGSGHASSAENLWFGLCLGAQFGVF